MKSYTVHFIRHGTTEGNEQGRYIGSTDLALSPGGAEHLHALGKKHSYPTAQVYLCSPMRRCTETMGILYPEAKPTLISGLRECDFGDWEGKTAGEIAGEDGRFRRWIAGDGEPVTPPNGEDGSAFAQRVCAAFEKIVEDLMRSGTTSTVIVTHGGVVMSILAAYGLPRAKFYDWMSEPGCGYSMRIIPGLWMRSRVGEVFSEIPVRPKQDGEGGERILIDLAREAADRAFGEKERKTGGAGNGREPK
ncbi:histidine phosphatase family protein [Caproiciproducens sp. NJN-50]|uniref:histidine phosphatase family protein n=1 Tax=Acutalibacteraceae TaxID=3082771 RepID=UPI000FFE2250|nr:MULTISPECIES: histidine phosphatase family protein [Acutalibacteraceae]QAT49203.1 histidine phosphatase family protein [Caproiciproducens sp. NJN-50]